MRQASDRGARKEAAMPKSWSAKRERQYEHIKEGYESRGASEDKAEEIAARTVNKERAEAGETNGSKSRKR
jgi:plasmid stabilization system protein ParE